MRRKVSNVCLKVPAHYKLNAQKLARKYRVTLSDLVIFALQVVVRRVVKDPPPWRQPRYRAPFNALSVTVAVPEDLYRAVQHAAGRIGCPIAELVRCSLEKLEVILARDRYPIGGRPYPVAFPPRPAPSAPPVLPIQAKNTPNSSLPAHKPF
jgi:hypothetical protein